MHSLCKALVFLLLACSPALAFQKVVFQPVIRSVGEVTAVDLRSVVKELNQRKYSNIDEIREAVRFAFQAHGYFKVRVEDPELSTQSEANERKVIPVQVKVIAGNKYRLGEIGFSPTSDFSTAQLRGAFPIAQGDVFARGGIAKGLETLRQMYCSKGFIDFSAVPETQVDELRHTVTLQIALDEGSVFRVGSLTVGGEESVPGARQRLLQGWKEFEGRTYTCETLRDFLHAVKARANIVPEQIFKASPDVQNRTVNVIVTLAKPIF